MSQFGMSFSAFSFLNILLKGLHQCLINVIWKVSIFEIVCSNKLLNTKFHELVMNIFWLLSFEMLAYIFIMIFLYLYLVHL